VLDRIVEHAREDLTITVEAGIPVPELLSHLRGTGQWIPALVGMEGTVGGVVACDRRNVLAGALGSVADALLGATFVAAGGEVVSAGGRVVKNVAGYDLMRLLTGSLGSVGAIVEVTLRALSLPESWGGVVCPVQDPNLPLQVLQEGPWWNPLSLLRYDVGEGERVAVLFAGSACRVASQIELARNRWGEAARVLSAPEAEALPVLLAARARPTPGPVGWGGALPRYLAGEEVTRALGGGGWWADLLRGHLWWAPEGEVDRNALVPLRRALAEGEGHLHLDVPVPADDNQEAWGREGGEEGRTWARLRAAVDPERTWAYGRLPGEGP